MGNPVVHFEVVGQDAAALQAFYRQAFDWGMVPALPAYAMAMPDAEGGIAGGVGSAPDGADHRVTFYIEVPDLDAALARVESLGGTRQMGPVDVPEGPSIALFADPEGHIVGLLKAGTRRSND